MSKRTKKPWNFRAGFMTIYAEDGHGEAVCDAPEGSEGMLDWPANARLIAAAPDLLEALKMWTEGFEKGYMSSSSKRAQKFRVLLWEKTESAINKAEGEKVREERSEEDE